MKLRKSLTIVGALLSLAWCASSAMASTALPYAQGFESFSVTPPWSAFGGGVVAANPSAALAGGQGLIVSNDTASLSISNLYPNIWIQIYAKPVTGANDPNAADQKGAFYITDAGVLRAYTGQWTTVSSGLPTNSYIGFTVHADTSGWDIYTGSVYKSSMTLLNSSGPLQFATSGNISNISVSSGNKAFLDGVAVSKGYTDTGSSSSGNKVQAYEMTNNTSLYEFVLPVYAAAYTNSGSPAAGKMVAGRVGDDIRSGMVAGDTMYVFGTDTNGATRYKINVLNGPFVAHDDNPAPPATAPTNMPIYTATRLQLRLAGSHPQTFSFFPYSSLTVLAEAGTATANATAASYSETVALNRISGISPGEPNGYTALVWSKTVSFATLQTLFGAVPMANGDRLFVATPAQPNAWVEYRWTSPNWIKILGGQPATGNLVAGSKVWVQRRSGGSQLTLTIPY